MVKGKYKVEKLRKTFPGKGQQYYYPNMKMIDNKASSEFEQRALKQQNTISLSNKRNRNNKIKDENNYSSESSGIGFKKFPSITEEDETELNIDKLLDEVF